MFGKPKLRCPKCGAKAKYRAHYEQKQCECPKCNYVGKTEEFERRLK